MKKMLLLLMIVLLCSCSVNEKEDNNDDEIEEPVQIIKTNNYDNLAAETYKPFKETFKNNEAWTLEGDGTFTSDLNKKVITVNSGNVTLNSERFMMKYGNYIVSFISSNKGRIKIASSGGTYLDTDFEKGEVSIDYQILDTDYEVLVSLNFEGDTEINDFSISSDHKTYGALINQITYLDKLNKEVVFNNNPGNYYSIYNALDDSLVYVGNTSEKTFDKDTNQWLYKGYFADLIAEGEYYIKTEFGFYSKVFNISNSYNKLINSALEAIYVQRCGCDTEGILGHPACHTAPSMIFSYTKEDYVDTTGGWHDAGDYGKYGIVENKVIADLLFSYLYGDNKNEKLVDEIKYGLDYVLKLQTDYGAVYNKVVSKRFAGFISPEKDNQKTYLLTPWTSVTASFAGITGLAYEVFKDSDDELAERCLNAHNKAIEYLINNPIASNEMNPDEFDVGTYYVNDETDERLFAYSVAYKLTKDDKYKDLCIELLNSGVDKGDFVANCRTYAYAVLLDSLEYNSKFYNEIMTELEAECNELCKGVSDNMFNYPYENYYWGSNQHVCEAINKLLLASRYFKDERYVVKASEMIDYILGLNVLDMSFIWGYGYKYPQTIHSRLAYAKGQNMIKGAMCNGVDQLLSDGEIGKYFSEDSPIATRFVDNSDSYSNVEPAINYNSALYLSLSLLEYANRKPIQ